MIYYKSKVEDLVYYTNFLLFCVIKNRFLLYESFAKFTKISIIKFLNNRGEKWTK